MSLAASSLKTTLLVSLVFLSYPSLTRAFTELSPGGAETIKNGSGVKSVVISPDGSKVYSMNLEEMSVYEFDRPSRKILRKLVFIPHTGTGFDYKNKINIDSSQEKPVEGHITHNGRYLWVSLHNGDGVVVWDLQGGETWSEGQQYKEAWLYGPGPTDKVNSGNSKVRLLWLKTGKTPKVVTSSPDGKYVFVANWHSSTVSVIGIDSNNPAEWHKIKDLQTGRVPRGLAVSPDSKFLYVAQMGGFGVSVVDLATLKKVDEIKVGANPRHIVTDGRFMYASLNAGSKITKVDLTTRKVVCVADSGKYPRIYCSLKEWENTLCSLLPRGCVAGFFGRRFETHRHLEVASTSGGD